MRVDLANHDVAPETVGKEQEIRRIKQHRTPRGTDERARNGSALGTGLKTLK